MNNKDSNPKVSVIIPTYNRGTVITRAIDSVLSQTYKNIEIVVIDDGSSDDTQTIISRRYAGKLIYKYQSNRGPSAARNSGLSLSSGAYINFLDSDDYFLAENIAPKVKVLNENPQVGWVFSDRYFISEAQGIYYHRIPFLEKNRELMLRKEDFFGQILLTAGQPTTTNTVLLRRECIECVGGWDEKFSDLDDVDFFLRISKSFKGKYIDRADIIQILSPDSLTTNLDKRYQATERLIEKIKSDHGQYISQNKLQWKWLKYQADFFNRYALHLYTKGEEKERTIDYFKRSITCYPFQKSAYIWLLRSFFSPHRS